PVLAPSDRRIIGWGCGLFTGDGVIGSPPITVFGVAGSDGRIGPDDTGDGPIGIWGVTTTPPLPTCEVSPSCTANIDCPLYQARCRNRRRASSVDSPGSLCHQRPPAFRATLSFATTRRTCS